MTQTIKNYNILDKVISDTLLSVIDMNTHTRMLTFLVASKENKELLNMKISYDDLLSYFKHNLLHPDDNEVYDQLLDEQTLDTIYQAYLHGQHFHMEVRSKLEANDKEYSWIRICIHFMEKLKKGYQVIASFEDVSNHKKRETWEQEKNDLRMKALSNVFEELYIVKPQEDKYYSLNVNEANKLKNTTDAYRFTDFISVIKKHVHPEDRKKCIEKFSNDNIIKACNKGLSEITLEYRIKHQHEKKYRWMAANILPSKEEQITAFVLIKDITEDMETIKLQMKCEMLEERMDLQLQYYESMRHYEDEIRAFRHDLKNHLIVLENLFEKGNRQAFKDYIDVMRGYTLDNAQKIYTENAIIDGLLNEKFAFARRCGINVKQHIRLAQELPLTPIEICILLGNSLDNAIEANNSISASQQERYIDFKLIYAHGACVLRVENSIDKQRKHKKISFETTKHDASMHGLGIQNMKQVVKKYNGEINITQKEDIVELMITLYFY